MATVYLAHDVKHDRPVALKVLHIALDDAHGRARFEREIRFAARLQHPHILSVIDSGETNGRCWFTMPHVRGESLRERLRRQGPLPPDEVVYILRQAAQALAYAHREGVIHRDIKPENILLTDDGETLVADFGVARALASDIADLGLTQPGSTVGTPLYMAPEQALGSDVQDARVDQYALAAVGYELLTGTPPFTGRTAGAVLEARMSQSVPSVRAVRSDVPPHVDDVLQRALSMEPDARFGSMTEFAQTLAPGMTSSGIIPILPPTRNRPWRRYALSAGALVVVAAMGLRWLGARAAAPVGMQAPRIAVLPFENQGDSADAYFADGVNDAIRGTLASLPGVDVIARGSVLPYRDTDKTPSEIARELGVRYLLMAVVRWEKPATGPSVVHLTPELVEVSSAGVATSRWQQRFDQPITNVFQVQADIAAKVTEAMRVALVSSTRAQLSAPPTASPAAYDAFLRGEAAIANGSNDPAAVRAGMAFYEEALRLDSTFVAAWARLSVARGLLYFNSTPTPELARAARDAAERAVALAPNSLTAHSAMADYYRFVALDPAAAQAELDQMRRVAPTNVGMLVAAAANARSLGRPDDAVRDYRAAVSLSPRSAGPSIGLASTLLSLRRFPEARAAAERAMTLAPSDLQTKQVRAMIALAEGDLGTARRVIADANGEVSPEMAVYMASYWDLGWMLDDAGQKSALAQGPEAHDDDRALHAAVLTQLHHWRGDAAATRRWAELAQREFAQQLREVPKDGQRHVLRGLMLAYLGRGDEAVAEARRGMELEPPSRDAVGAAYYRHLLARIHVLNAQPDDAIAELETLLRTPYFLSAALLRIDPTWDPLRQHPRFQQLMSGN